ncbi:DUF1684 domain-containing protein [Jiulongibacter sediminis]|uniref:DUF1684 domain-containing protein n=1 Tax=Jiulongibacter sediminis TaxID=1605367 RepID=UPI0009E7A11D|nr:DUF1684 domain-containing protein [Jiulongibacter sediminis]
MNRPKITKCHLAHPIISLIGLFFLTHPTFAQGFEKDVTDFRKTYKQEFLDNPNAPLKVEDLKFLDFFEPDEKYKVKCKFKLKGKGEPFEILTSSGDTKTYVVFGQFIFKINGKKQKLNVYRSLALMQNPLYKDYLFIPFKDLTNGSETYGGGRYIDLRMKELEGDEIWLDFNKAYNPYCAFSAGYSCPIPPIENHLKVTIRAGEKNYLGEYKGVH